MAISIVKPTPGDPTTSGTWGATLNTALDTIVAGVNTLGPGNATTRAAFSYDTTANWTAVNPVLGLHERAVDTTALTARIGDGVTAYLSLPLEQSATYAPRSIPAGAVACYALTDGRGGVTLYDINGAVL